ncbi:MAG: hypothetical protein JO138_20225 [Acidobacteriaceae bacterium]|nr:hypothetical protein [Acidobacteriaceae bacterium]
MTALDQVNAYLRGLELRLRLFAASRGAAIIAALALVLTIVLVWIGNRYEFAAHIISPLRILLFSAIAFAVSFALAAPLLKLNRGRVTRLAEQRIPQFQEGLLTASERSDSSNPFTELVAEDALTIARQHPPEKLAPHRALFAWIGSGVVAAAILIWLIAAGPGYWGYGAGLLWTGTGSPDKRPLYDVKVQPGNATIRRKSDQMITARLLGFSARNVTLHARYEGTTKWETTPMQPAAQGYRFLFAGLSDAVEYYVQADAAVSRNFKISVKDLPAVRRVKATIHFPSQLHLQDVAQDPGGDIRAVIGSKADVAVLTDRPLARGVLVLEDGSKVELKHAEGNWLTATLPINKQSSYHVAAIDGADAIRISDDWFIEAKKDEPPSIRIARPGRDPHVSPIEEVPVSVEAADDFGVEALDLHYSINGGTEQTVPLLRNRGAKDARGTTTLYLEKYKLQPGDLISLYATARDANTTSRSDILFAQTEPFDLKFSQSQASGMGMGMGMGDQDNISERQKQVIAATFNELKDPAKARAALQEDARFLSDLESKIGDQAKTLAERMGNRELTGTSAEFENFSKIMTQASQQTGEAISELKSAKWRDALPPEQKVLQSLLRAEAMFRDIQVAFGSNAGGMGGSGAQRDLARMFDLELDTSKNQYETQQSASQAASEQQKAVDEAFERLQMLARRQQELAAQNNQEKPFEQRWQEEQLRREAEQLRQQMEQLAQNSQSQGQSSNSQSGQQSASSAGRNQSRAGNGGRSMQQNQELARAMQQTTDALRRAEDEMRKAVSEHDAAAQQRAAAQLAAAEDSLNRALHQRAGSSVGDMAQRAQQLAEAQRNLANRMKQLYGQSGSSGDASSESEMPAMNDPENPGYGSMYRRRYWQQLSEPKRPATEQEKALAGENEKLSDQVERLQRDMQQEEQSLAATQPDAASKLRSALSNAEQEELALRLRKNSEWMRDGFGDRNLEMEDGITKGIEQLSRELRDAEQAASSSGRNQSGADREAEQALSQIRAMRDMLQQAEENQQGGPTGASNGQDTQQAQSGQYSPYGGIGQPGINQRGIERRGLQDAIAQLYAYRRRIDPNDRTLGNYIDGTLGYLRDLNANPDVLDATVSHDAVASLERLEVELSRRAGQPSALAARTTSPEAAPEKYRQAVAEYFKKLSQPK